jgi:hypothetical protein
MSLDLKLMLDEFNRRLDDMETRLDRCFSPSLFSVNHSFPDTG